ncbi:MAG: hypothetical protein U1F38_04885 [Ottowia sp.]
MMLRTGVMPCADDEHGGHGRIFVQDEVAPQRQQLHQGAVGHLRGGILEGAGAAHGGHAQRILEGALTKEKPCLALSPLNPVDAGSTRSPNCPARYSKPGAFSSVNSIVPSATCFLCSRRTS